MEMCGCYKYINNEKKQQNIIYYKNGKIVGMHGEISCVHYSLLFVIKLHFKCLFNYELN